ncbi:MAG TPA: permease [Verrucomicrobiales bacterium]|nr:permease [Verrucomicrobiales bacterium]
MNNPDSYYDGAAVIDLDENSRANFIAKTYMHLTGAIFAFAGIEVFLFTSGIAQNIAAFLMQGSWLIVLGGFMIVGWLASSIAHRSVSLPAQYAALAAYVVAESIIFVPLLFYAEMFAPGAISAAALVTFIGFAVLTAIVFVTRKDFSFLRGILLWGFGLALVAIVASVLFGMNLGTWFSVAMVGLAGAAVLYNTSNVLHHYSEDRYVAAALQLFAAIALMFWYILRLFIASRD